MGDTKSYWCHLILQRVTTLTVTLLFNWRTCQRRHPIINTVHNRILANTGSRQRVQKSVPITHWLLQTNIICKGNWSDYVRLFKKFNLCNLIQLFILTLQGYILPSREGNRSLNCSYSEQALHINCSWTTYRLWLFQDYFLLSIYCSSWQEEKQSSPLQVTGQQLALLSYATVTLVHKITSNIFPNSQASAAFARWG